MFFWPWKNSVRISSWGNVACKKQWYFVYFRYNPPLFRYDIWCRFASLSFCIKDWWFNEFLWTDMSEGFANWELDINIPIKINSLPNYFFFQMPYFATNNGMRLSLFRIYVPCWFYLILYLNIIIRFFVIILFYIIILLIFCVDLNCD